MIKKRFNKNQSFASIKLTKKIFHNSSFSSFILFISLNEREGHLSKLNGNSFFSYYEILNYVLISLKIISYTYLYKLNEQQ